MPNMPRNQIHFLLSFSFLLVRCETASCARCRLKMCSTNKLHLLMCALVLPTPFPPSQITLSQMRRGLQVKRLPSVVRVVNVSSHRSEWCLCGGTPFTQKTNLSYLTCLCNTRLAFIVLTEKKKLPFLPHSLLILEPYCQAFLGGLPTIFMVNCTLTNPCQMALVQPVRCVFDGRFLVLSVICKDLWFTRHLLTC